MYPGNRRPGGRSLALATVLVLAALCLQGSGPSGGVLFPAEYSGIVRIWRESGPVNSAIASELDGSSWATLVVPFSILSNLEGGAQMRSTPLSIAHRELSRGRYGATLPVFRQGIGTVIVINDLKLAELEPTSRARREDESRAGYLARVREATLAAVLAHEATHSLQFLRGQIYPGPGRLPYPGHDQQDELEAYLNIDTIYQRQLGLTLSPQEYAKIVRQDYANLPIEALSHQERTQAFIEQRGSVDRNDGYGRPAEFRQALDRIEGKEELFR